VIVAVNNDADPVSVSVATKPGARYAGVLSGESAVAVDGRLDITIPANSGEIWVENGACEPAGEPVLVAFERAGEVEPAPPSQECLADLDVSAETLLAAVPVDKPYEEMTVEELQSVILAKLAQCGPITDRMRQEVADNVWRDSLVTWARSFGQR
jgi:hypothetical protein